MTAPTGRQFVTERPCPRCGNQTPIGILLNGTYCKPCRRERSAEWKRANPDKVRGYRAKERAKPGYGRRKQLGKHGMTPEKFEELFDAQGRACAICRIDTPTGQGWHIDHDHACCPKGQDQRCGDCYRGILCHGCNIGLGMFGDDTLRLRAAIRYLLER